MPRAEYVAVAEDIEFLRKAWTGAVEGEVLRRGSAQLRLLIVEDLLGHAWRGCGFLKQPNIPAIDLETVVHGMRANIESAFAGGGEVDGAIAALALVARGNELDPRPVLPDPPPMRDFPLNEFAGSLAFYSPKATLTRRDVVKYFANVKGGVHHQSSGRMRKKEEDLVRRVGKFEGRYRIMRFDGLYFELLSIGQAIAHAPDVVRLVARIRGED